MYCQKCGTENNDGSAYCSKCGNQFKSDSGITKTKTSNKMFAGFLLNIFSVVVPMLMIFGINMLSTPDTDTDVDVSVEFTAEYSSLMLLITMITGVVIFTIGMVIYFHKNVKIKKALSLVYLVTAIADLCLLFINTMTYLLSTCGLGVVMYIPGILQIIAGTKYISAVREYEA